MQQDSFSVFVGSQLRQFRINRDLSLQDVADRVGVTKKTIANYELGHTTIKLEMVKRLCQVYGVDFNSLMTIAQQHV